MPNETAPTASPSPTAHTAPTAQVPLLGGETRSVVFGLGRLVKIEAAMGKTANALCLDEFQALAPADPVDPFDPNQDEDKDAAKARLEERNREAARRVGVTFMASFTAACLDVATDRLDELLDLERLREAFTLLAVAFIDAVARINGAREPQPDPQTPAAAG